MSAYGGVVLGATESCGMFSDARAETNFVV
jgi:hypothetical protein